MAYRKKVNTGKDAKIFKKTASSTKAINVRPKTMRGGIRLWKNFYMQLKMI